MFQKSMILLPIYGMLLSSFSVVNVNGDCSSDVEEIYSAKDFNELTAAYIEAFGIECGSVNTCEASNYEETLVALNNLIEESGGPQDSLSLTTVPTQAELEELGKDLQEKTDIDKFSELILKNPPPLSIKATADFLAFTEDETYVAYATACEEEGGTITLVDVEFNAVGTDAFATYTEMLDADGGIDMDVQLFLYSLPVCLAESCKDEKDLSKTVDKILLSQLLQADVDEVSDTVGVDVSGVDATNLIEQFASFEAFCRVGSSDGLDQCSFNVYRSGSGGNGGAFGKSTTSSAMVNNEMTMFGIMTMLASTYVMTT